MSKIKIICTLLVKCAHFLRAPQVYFFSSADLILGPMKRRTKMKRRTLANERTKYAIANVGSFCLEARYANTVEPTAITNKLYDSRIKRE